MCYNKNINDLKGGFFMAKKATRRLYALGESIILTEGEKIIKCYNFEQEELFEALDEALNKKEIKQPALFFKEAIESLTGENFGDVKRKLKIGGIEHSIYDQKIYKVCENFINNDERLIKARDLQKNRIESYKKYKYEQRVINSYYGNRHNRDIDYIRKHMPEYL